MTRLVLFDIDGTLIRTGGAGTRAFAKTFASAFNAHHGVEQMKFAGRTDTSLVREFFGIHGIPATADNYSRFFTVFVHWLDHILSQSKTEECPGVRWWLSKLRALPHSPVVGLLTGNIRLGAEIKLRHFGLWQEFELGAFADDHEDRDQIAHVARSRGAQRLGVQLRGEEILVIGDTPLDIRCARAIGARVLAVATGGASLEDLKYHQPDWAVADLTQINPRQVCT